MEKHRNIELTDSETVISNLYTNTGNYMEAIKMANREIASAQMNLEINECALGNLEEFLRIIDLSKNQLKYTVSMIGGIEDLTSSTGNILGDDDDGDGYGSRSLLVQEPFRNEAIQYEEEFNVQRKTLIEQTRDIEAKVDGFKTIISKLIENLKPMMKELESVQESQRKEEERLLDFRKTGEAAMDVVRKMLEEKKIEIHQKVLDNECVIENTNKLMEVYKSNIETDIRASFSEATRKEIAEAEKSVKERERLTVLKTLYDESLLNDKEYTDKKKEELENFEIKKLKEKLTNLENYLNDHAHTFDINSTK
jgi:hypothetical protein